jgi:hypothetical protein
VGTGDKPLKEWGRRYHKSSRPISENKARAAAIAKATANGTLYKPLNRLEDCWPVPKGKVPLGEPNRGFGVYVAPELKEQVQDMRRRAAKREHIAGEEMIDLAVAIATEMLESGKPSQVKAAMRALHDFGKQKEARTINAKAKSLPKESLGELPEL